MSRPRKSRKICHFPQNLSFCPTEFSEKMDTVILTVDEYETIRLIDREGCSQEACADRMGVARTTVQLIYASARRKLAEMLVDARPLQIAGGDYRLCDGAEDCGQKWCYKQRYYKQYKKPKGEILMRIAVTYENGLIFQHFGHTQAFKVYDVQDGKIIASEIIDTKVSGHGALAGVLAAIHADVLICGGIGGGAQMALAAAGIRLYGGVSGSADAAVEALIAGNLPYNPNVRCNHQGEHHNHGEGHNCGSHGCQ